MPPDSSTSGQAGITRSVGAPAPEYIFTITRGASLSPSGNPTLQITSAIRESDRRSTDGSQGTASIVPLDEEKLGLIDKVYDILKRRLRLLDGFATVDFYGLDMGIEWSSEELEWANSGPRGCVQGGFGALRADEEQQRSFEEAVNMILRLVGHQEWMVFSTLTTTIKFSIVAGLFLCIDSASAMPPQEFSFRLQKGITGGFALPTPDHIFTVTKGPSFSPSENNTLQITAAIREVGTPSIESFGPAKVVDVDEEKSRLIDRLYEILQSLPTGGKEGYPTADIYGLDIGIMWEGAGLSWANSGPEGCGQGGFEEGASADQKTAFREAVDIVNAIVGFDKEKNQLRG